MEKIYIVPENSSPLLAPGGHKFFPGDHVPEKFALQLGLVPQVNNADRLKKGSK